MCIRDRQKGIARGIFSNEAGIGSAPIAAAAAQNDSPAKQGLISMLGTDVYKRQHCGRIVTAYVPLRSATGAHRTKVRACRVSYTLPRATGLFH